MKISDRTLWLAFVAATLSPILALVVKPGGYSFYMFFPATPDTAIGRFRLVAGDAVLVVGFIVAVASAIGLMTQEKGWRRAMAFFALLLVAANPLQQPIFLESLDTHMNYRLRDRAEASKIVGKSKEEVRRLFGTPTSTTAHMWEYQPLLIYWFGSRCQVFFAGDIVTGFEANDD